MNKKKDILNSELIIVAKKNPLYLSVKVFSTKVLTGDTIFYVSYWRRDRHFTLSSEPREGLTVRRAKGVPSFLSLRPWVLVRSRSVVKRSTDRANPAAEERNKMASKFPVFLLFVRRWLFIYLLCSYHNAWRNNGNTAHCCTRTCLQFQSSPDT